jgi:hypothetical protein
VTSNRETEDGRRLGGCFGGGGREEGLQVDFGTGDPSGTVFAGLTFLLASRLGLALGVSAKIGTFWAVVGADA